MHWKSSFLKLRRGISNYALACYIIVTLPLQVDIKSYSYISIHQMALQKADYQYSQNEVER